MVDTSLAAVVICDYLWLLFRSLCHHCFPVPCADEDHIPPPFQNVTHSCGVLREGEDGGEGRSSFNLHQVGWQLWLLFLIVPTKVIFSAEAPEQVR